MGDNKTAITFLEHDNPDFRDRIRTNVLSSDITLAFTAGSQSTADEYTKSVAGPRYIPVDISSWDGSRGASLADNLASSVEYNILRNIHSRAVKASDVIVYITGSGAFPLLKAGFTQDDADAVVTGVLAGIQSGGRVRFTSIRCSGLAGFDESGIRAAAALNVPVTVLAPNGWRYRDWNGTSISDETVFKSRFSSCMKVEDGTRLLQPDYEEAYEDIPLFADHQETGYQSPEELVQEREPSREEIFREKARRAVESGRLRSVGAIHDGWAVVREPGGLYNYSDLDGKFMSKKWFDSASDFYQGKARVKRGGYDITIDTSGIVLTVSERREKRIHF